MDLGASLFIQLVPSYHMVCLERFDVGEYRPRVQDSAFLASGRVKPYRPGSVDPSGRVKPYRPGSVDPSPRTKTKSGTEQLVCEEFGMTSTCVLFLPKKCYVTIDLPPVRINVHTVEQHVMNTMEQMNDHKSVVRNVCVRIYQGDVILVRLPMSMWKFLLDTIKENGFDRIVIPFSPNGTEGDVRLVTGGWYSNAIGTPYDYKLLAQTLRL